MAGPTPKMDQGWAWVVLAGSWMSLFLVCFLTASAGIIQVEMVEDLGVGAGPVSFMTSCALGLASLLGPLSGVMASLLSARVTVFLGTLLMSLGMLATSLSYSVLSMMIFYGFITGLGFGIAYSPMVVINSFYFEKYRMLANGVILCASGVGMLSLPYFERYIIDSHGWRFAFALNGTIMLHILVFAAVFFPTEIERKNMIKFSSCFLWKMWRGNEETANENKRNNNTIDGICEPERVLISCHQITNGGVQSRTFDLIRKSGLLVDSSSIKYMSQNLSFTGNESNSYIHISAAEAAEGDKSVQPLLDDSHLTPAREAPLKNGLLPEEKEQGVFQSSPFRQRTLSELSARSTGSTITQTSMHGISHPKEAYTFGQLRKDCSGGRSYLGSSFGWASSDLGSSLMLPLKIEEVISGEVEESSLKGQIIRICRHKAVWILSVNSLFFMSAFAIHAIHFPAFAESKGMSRVQVAQFYIAFGLVLMFGRLGGGWIFNKLKPPLCTLMFILQSLNGISMALAPYYATTPVGIYVMQASFGLLYGQSYMVLPAVLAQIMGVQDLTIAFGVIHLFMGLGYIIAPVIAGFIFDATETYDIPYYIGGSLYLLGALSLLLMIFVKRDADAGKMVNGVVDQKEHIQDGDKAIKKNPLVGSHNTRPTAEEEKLCV